jgi:hypothetical protein
MRILLAIALVMLVASCDDHPTDPGLGSTGLDQFAAVGPPLGLGGGPPSPRLIDFENPDLGGGKEPLERFVDSATGIEFTAVQIDPFDDFVVGIVPNGATSACVPGDPLNQTLGTGRATSPGSLGFAAAPIRVEFPTPLLRGTIVSVRFQARVGTPFRLTLFDRHGTELAVTQGAVTNAVGTCVAGRPESGFVTLEAEAPGRVVSAVLEQTSNSVFVVDNLMIDPQRGPGG